MSCQGGDAAEEEEAREGGDDQDSLSSASSSSSSAAWGRSVGDSDSDGGSSSSESEEFRARMEGLLQQQADDQGFTGKELASLIYQKYGRSYDVQLVKAVSDVHGNSTDRHLECK